MEEEEDFGGVAVAFGEGEEVEVVVSDVEVLGVRAFNQPTAMTYKYAAPLQSSVITEILERTLTPSSEKHGGTAELSSSASLRRMGNFSTADMGMSPL